MCTLHSAMALGYTYKNLLLREQLTAGQIHPPQTAGEKQDSQQKNTFPSDDEHSLLSLAHQLYKTGNYTLALENTSRLLAQAPQRTDVLLLEGAIHFQLHNYDECIRKNMEAIKIDPQFVECYGNLANALKEKGQVDLAIQYYLIAIQLRPSFADAWSNLASAYMRKSMPQQAADCCRRALALNPLLVDAHSNLGNLLQSQGYLQHAYLCYLEALRIQPSYAVAWSNLAGLFVEAGDYFRALEYYREAIRLDPSFADAHLHQGNVLKATGRLQEAIYCYQQAIQLCPDMAIAYGNLASVYYEQGQLDLAIMTYREAIIVDSSFMEAYNNLGNALKDSGRVEEAMTCYQACLLLAPNHPQALTNLGNIYLEWSMMNEAMMYYKHALAATTGLSAPYSNLATVYKQQGRYTEAIVCYNEVMRIDPLAADGLVNRGNTYKEMGRVNEAIQDYLQAVVIQPTMAEGHANLASAYKDSGHVDLAIQSYKHALTLRADFPEATCNLLHTLQCVCDWEDRETKFVELEGILRGQLRAGTLPSVQPFHALAYPIDPLLALDISKKYAEHCAVAAARLCLPEFEHPRPLALNEVGGSGRLRVGYVSSDFGNHPLSHLMGSVFGMHNRKIIEVFCYSLSPSDGSEWRQRISAEAEHFIDVSAASVDDIARQIAADGIQILVNLNGYTKGARNEVFALRPAPIQVSYMGFPGTTGANYIDYLVTDEVVSPPEFAHLYSEKLVYVPHCYFVNDYKQTNRDCLDATNAPSRKDVGLPEDKFIFCCFNQLYKMDPSIFKTWCNILKKVTNSALWLLRFPAAGESHLRAFALAEGVQPDQIIFTDVAAKHEHIRRSALADLFLDTPLCNAHTTGTDVLWAGCPIITLPLERMATRVAASLCHAAGFAKEMVVSSMEEYEERAVYYATNPAALRRLTQRLHAARIDCPLFDTERWVRNLDRGYILMWDVYCRGEAPRSFKIDECEESSNADVENQD
eukprot:TRINITY_DN2002_c0_g3_i1.p1 TRINITY_DN2002_c0_g3~~TRINITY_DN2002_c0_g3_i1.p1  ORF type:complete len:980 (-),score=185.90 TRINITY_DN2002_c0_g3_i1:691-3630(-)